MAAYTNTITREVDIDRLEVDPLFAGLFIEEPGTIGRIARDMRTNGYDPQRPVDVWKDGAGRGRHVVVEGHQRLAAARAAGLTTVRVAYRHFGDRYRALLWAAEQQSNRRNASREARALSILRTLDRAGEAGYTTAELSERFGFSTATIDRARQVLARGTESEVVAVLEGEHGLKAAYELIKQRERTERAPVRDDEPEPAPAPEPEPEDTEPEAEGPVMPELIAVQDVLTAINEAVDNALELFDSNQRHVLGATSEHRRALIDDITVAANAMADAATRFEAAAEAVA